MNLKMSCAEGRTETVMSSRLSNTTPMSSCKSVRHTGRRAMGLQGEERAWLETGRVTEGNAVELGFKRNQGSPCWSSGLRLLRSQCRGPQFNPWSGELDPTGIQRKDSAYCH